MSSPSEVTGIRIKEYTEIWRLNGNSLNETNGIHPSFQMEFDHTVDHTVDLNLMI